MNVAKLFEIYQSKSDSEKADIITYLQDPNLMDPASIFLGIYYPMTYSHSCFLDAVNTLTDPQATILVAQTSAATFLIPSEARYVFIDTASNNNTSTLPTTAEGLKAGDSVMIKKMSANNTITLNVENAGTIDGVSNYVLTSEREIVRLVFIGNDSYETI